jgi:hypothetical protein
MSARTVLTLDDDARGQVEEGGTEKQRARGLRVEGSEDEMKVPNGETPQSWARLIGKAMAFAVLPILITPTEKLTDSQKKFMRSTIGILHAYLRHCETMILFLQYGIDDDKQSAEIGLAEEESLTCY